MKKIVFLILSVFIFTNCASDQKNTGMGTGIGAAAGAVVGAVIGHQSGNRDKGALIGAALGGGLGAYVGNRMDKQAKELEKIAETRRTEQGLVTKLKSDILFDTGKSELKDQAGGNLTKMANIMKKYPENVLTIRGYTDNIGSSQVNEELSRGRADSVKSQLVGAGLPSNAISTVGMGPANPVGDNKTKEGRKLNRRVEIEITVDQTKVPKEK